MDEVLDLKDYELDEEDDGCITEDEWLEGCHYTDWYSYNGVNIRDFL